MLRAPELKLTIITDMRRLSAVLCYHARQQSEDRDQGYDSSKTLLSWSDRCEDQEGDVESLTGVVRCGLALRCAPYYEGVGLGVETGIVDSAWTLRGKECYSSLGLVVSCLSNTVHSGELQLTFYYRALGAVLNTIELGACQLFPGHRPQAVRDHEMHRVSTPAIWLR